jgi:hypothetical protein
MVWRKLHPHEQLARGRWPVGFSQMVVKQADLAVENLVTGTLAWPRPSMTTAPVLAKNSLL